MTEVEGFTIDGNKFECLLCGEWHEVTDNGWQFDENWNMNMKVFVCTANRYYIFADTTDGILPFMTFNDYIQLQDGELK